MRNIIFYHYCVNGDCFTSRILVDHFIKNVKNVVFYYTAFRSLASHCLDLGITNNNFNVIRLPGHNDEDFPEHDKHDNFFIYNNDLYINPWIGKFKSKFCIWCLDNYIDYYNSIISNINKNVNEFNIPQINNTITPYVPFNYKYYNCEFLNDYIVNLKKQFKKIILFYNNFVTTYILFNNLDYTKLINIISEYYPDFIFITFKNTDLNKPNVIDISTIYINNNFILPNAYGIEFTYLNTLCDKVFFSPSGLSQLGFYNENMIKNKYAILYCKCNLITPMCICDECENENLCIEKYHFYCKKIWIDTDNLIYQIEHFINLPYTYG